MLVHSNTEQESAICSKVFRVVYASIEKAGDQGLSIEEVSQIIDIPGVRTAGLIINVLQGYGQVLKVNAYNSVRVVHALYHSKYFLAPLAGFDKRHQPSYLTKSMQRSGDCHMSNYAEKLDTTGAKSKMERNTSIDDGHKVTILNFPEDDLEPSNENQISNMNEGCSQGKVGSHGVNYENERLKFPSVEVYTTMDQWRWDHQQHCLQVTSTTCSWNRDAKSRDIRGTCFSKDAFGIHGF